MVSRSVSTIEHGDYQDVAENVGLQDVAENVGLRAAQAVAQSVEHGHVTLQEVAQSAERGASKG